MRFTWPKFHRLRAQPRTRTSRCIRTILFSAWCRPKLLKARSRAGNKKFVRCALPLNPQLKTESTVFFSGNSWQKLKPFVKNPGGRREKFLNPQLRKFLLRTSKFKTTLLIVCLCNHFLCKKEDRQKLETILNKTQKQHLKTFQFFDRYLPVIFLLVLVNWSVSLLENQI